MIEFPTKPINKIPFKTNPACIFPQHELFSHVCPSGPPGVPILVTLSPRPYLSAAELDQYTVDDDDYDDDDPELLLSVLKSEWFEADSQLKSNRHASATNHRRATAAATEATATYSRRASVGANVRRGGASSGGYQPPQRVFQCKCSRTYLSRGSMVDHQKWECGKQPTFQCPYCDYCAKRKKHLTRHITVIHRRQPFI